jgi:hypothetical protein
MALDEKKVAADFAKAVNMSAKELTGWLKTDESKGVGFRSEEGDESVGHASGRRIIDLLGKKKAVLTDDDLAHMRKVVGYVHRHLAQQPADTEHSRWRYSLMNWGHDPTRKGPAK